MTIPTPSADPAGGDWSDGYYAPVQITSSATPVIDYTTGKHLFRVTLTANATFTTNGVPTDGIDSFLEITQDATGSRTATWPASFRWMGGTAPTLTTTAGKIDRITLRWNAGLGQFLANATLNF